MKEPNCGVVTALGDDLLDEQLTEHGVALERPCLGIAGEERGSLDGGPHRDGDLVAREAIPIDRADDDEDVCETIATRRRLNCDTKLSSSTDSSPFLNSTTMSLQMCRFLPGTGSRWRGCC